MREKRKGRGGRGTIRSGGPLMLSICPYLSDNTTHRGTPCALYPMKLHIVRTRSRVYKYRGVVCRVCVQGMLKTFKHYFETSIL